MWDDTICYFYNFLVNQWDYCGETPFKELNNFSFLSNLPGYFFFKFSMNLAYLSGNFSCNFVKAFLNLDV